LNVFAATKQENQNKFFGANTKKNGLK